MNVSDLKDKIVACCGLVCTDCPAFQATKANDAQSIAEVAKKWSEEFKADIKPEAVWCDGCTQPGRKCGHCGECEIRICAMARSAANCGLCDDMAGCEKIQGFFKIVPCAGDVIRSIAAGGNP